MTIDETIEFCNEKSKNILRTEPEAFEQIAEWLEELKTLRKEFERASLVFAFNFKLSHDRLINDAMETTAKVICKECEYLDKTKCTYKGRHCSVIKPMLADVIKELEQLKERIQ